MTQQQLKGIKIYSKEQSITNGVQLAPGWQEAWDFTNERRGAVQYDALFYPTIPLNTQRVEALREALLKTHNIDSSLEPGVSIVAVPEVLYDLPALSQVYVDMIQDLPKDCTALIEVVLVEPSYGCHIVVTPFTLRGF